MSQPSPTTREPLNTLLFMSISLPVYSLSSLQVLSLFMGEKCSISIEISRCGLKFTVLLPCLIQILIYILLVGYLVHGVSLAGLQVLIRVVYLLKSVFRLFIPMYCGHPLIFVISTYRTSFVIGLGCPPPGQQISLFIAKWL